MKTWQKGISKKILWKAPSSNEIWWLLFREEVSKLFACLKQIHKHHSFYLFSKNTCYGLYVFNWRQLKSCRVEGRPAVSSDAPSVMVGRTWLTSLNSRGKIQHWGKAQGRTLVLRTQRHLVLSLSASLCVTEATGEIWVSSLISPSTASFWQLSLAFSLLWHCFLSAQTSQSPWTKYSRRQKGHFLLTFAVSARTIFVQFGS